MGSHSLRDRYIHETTDAAPGALDTEQPRLSRSTQVTTLSDPRPRRRTRKRLAVTIVAAVLAALLATAGWSFVSALEAPGSDSVSARSVEWLRTHHFGGMVDVVEHWWYSHHPPPVGGVPRGGIPTVPAPQRVAWLTPATSTAGPGLAPPAPIAAPASPALPGEGAWRPTGALVQGGPAVYVTYVRPDATHTSLLVGAAYFDSRKLRAVLVPGLTSPPHADRAWGARVPTPLRRSLVAAFNSAFALNDARGGYYAQGHTYARLRPGAASLVIRRDGTVDVGKWGRDDTTRGVTAVRQNLDLIVDHGRVVRGLPQNSNGRWGATVGNKVYVWRSGVGVTASGGVVYVAGPGLSVETLARLLARAHAVRAMELDINHEWVSCYLFHHSATARTDVVTGRALVPGTVRAGDRYLIPGTRDFVAWFARS